MERDPATAPSGSPAAEIPPPPSSQEREGFLGKLRRKVRRSPEAPRQQVAAAERLAPRENRTPERRRFGRGVLALLLPAARTERPAAHAPQPVVTAEVLAAPTPETTPQFDRATRMRRFARVVVARVLGEAAQEPARARSHRERSPVSTRPLVEAAHELRDATDALSDTIRDARDVSTGAESARVPDRAHTTGSDYDAPRPRGPEARPSYTQSAADRIDDRLRLLEQSAEASKTATLAAIGLGVIAVLVTGTEYFGRKHGERNIRSDMKKQFKQQERAVRQQRSDFNHLRESFTTGMNRTERKEYYAQLSTFTHQQAERTREASRELQATVVQKPALPGSPPVKSRVEIERRAWQPHLPERSEPKSEQAPLRRVETADTTERVPGQQTGNAGTGFFGGGGGGIARGTGPSDLQQHLRTIQPDSREARQLEALRKAEQARLQQNAWLYSAALVLAMMVLVGVTVVLG